MKTESNFSMVREYECPTVIFFAVAVERGFAASFGDEGAAGDFFDEGFYEI